MRSLTRLGVAALLGFGCAESAPPPDATKPDGATGDSGQYPVVPDFLALTAPAGVTVWFTGARVGADSAGNRCLERGLTIVRDTGRILVPLLMTGTAPTLVNDTTIRARIWLHCRPGNTYDIDLRTGHPTRIR